MKTSDRMTYTIEQIADYLASWATAPWDEAEKLGAYVTHNALRMLNDPQDGIAAWRELRSTRNADAGPSGRLVCSEWRCRWVGPVADALREPDPFNDGEVLIACPKCREQTLRACCDELGCAMEATCGTPTPAGYRWTCWNHMPKGESATNEGVKP